MNTTTIIPVTGTFIDGIACDIPSNNWTHKTWTKELEAEKAMGIDTIIFIRVGWGDSAMYDSKVMETTLYPKQDLLEFLLSEADRLQLKAFMGLFDTRKYWIFNEWDKEVEVNFRVIDELEERYLHHPSFQGWYISHEGDIKFHQEKVWLPIAKKMRADTPGHKIMISPRYAGIKYEPHFAVTPEIHAKHFDYLYGVMEGNLDIAAFMDGHVDFRQLPEFLQATKEISDKHGIEFWSNLETFDRDMPWRFPPIEWTKMRFKLDAAQKYVKKIITFEAPHFLSHNSCFPAAGHLLDSYLEYLNQ